MNEKLVKCKNHIMISDHAPNSLMAGFGAYGSYFQFLKYFIYLPKIIWHNMNCVENPYWHERSQLNWNKFDKINPNWYAEHLKLVIKHAQAIVSPRIETLQ